MGNRNFNDHKGKEPEIAYSHPVKAGRRIYYLDVKRAKNDDLYICITESKKKQVGEAETPSFEKHKIFLYKEDFSKFVNGLEDVINYAKQHLGEYEEREEYDAAEEKPQAEAAEPEKKLGIFSRFIK